MARKLARLAEEAADATGGPDERVSGPVVTNAVKHFKWQARGKRRIHDKPNRTEVVACHQWIDAELAALPTDAVVVALGATAGQSLLGPSFRVGEARGAALSVGPRPLVATIHPSAILRERDEKRRHESFEGLVADLERAAALAPAP